MSMSLEQYLEFLSPDDIRIKDTRVGIETVIRAFCDGHYALASRVATLLNTLTADEIENQLLYI